MEKKKSIFKRWWFWAIVVFLIAAIGSSLENDKASNNDNQSSAATETAGSSEKSEDTDTTETNETTSDQNQKREIDTSVFENAEKVEVTDAIDSNQHVTVFVYMSEEPEPGFATQTVFNQAYDFLQQPDLEGAKTVTIAVKQGNRKIAQITVNKEKFKPDDQRPMSDVVLEAAKIDSMIDEVKEYGKIMGSW